MPQPEKTRGRPGCKQVSAVGTAAKEVLSEQEYVLTACVEKT